MTREDFLNLTEEEQTAVLSNFEQLGTDFTDVEAERNSLKSDYEKQLSLITELRTELKKTKEVNYTLARQVTKEEKEPEDLLHDLFSVK